MTEDERMLEHKLEIPNPDKASDASRLVLNTLTGEATLFDKKGELISNALLGSRERTRFIRQDRYAKKYPSTSPYTYALNKPSKVCGPIR